MAHRIVWERTTTSRKLGTRVEVQPDGTKKIKAKTDKVEFDYPKITCDTPNDLVAAVNEVLAAGKPGFERFDLVMSHINHGTYRHLAVMYNSGQDSSVTPEQRKAIKMYYQLVNMPGSALSREDAIKLLTLQGVGNAESAFDAYGNDDDAEGNGAA